MAVSIHGWWFDRIDRRIVEYIKSDNVKTDESGVTKGTVTKRTMKRVYTYKTERGYNTSTAGMTINILTGVLTVQLAGQGAGVITVAPIATSAPYWEYDVNCTGCIDDKLGVYGFECTATTEKLETKTGSWEGEMDDTKWNAL